MGVVSQLVEDHRDGRCKFPADISKMLVCKWDHNDGGCNVMLGKNTLEQIHNKLSQTWSQTKRGGEGGR